MEIQFISSKTFIFQKFWLLFAISFFHFLKFLFYPIAHKEKRILRFAAASPTFQDPVSKSRPAAGIVFFNMYQGVYEFTNGQT